MDMMWIFCVFSFLKRKKKVEKQEPRRAKERGKQRRVGLVLALASLPLLDQMLLRCCYELKDRERRLSLSQLIEKYHYVLQMQFIMISGYALRSRKTLCV